MEPQEMGPVASILDFYETRKEYAARDLSIGAEHMQYAKEFCARARKAVIGAASAAVAVVFEGESIEDPESGFVYLTLALVTLAEYGLLLHAGMFGVVETVLALAANALDPDPGIEVDLELDGNLGLDLGRFFISTTNTAPPEVEMPSGGEVTLDTAPETEPTA